MEDHVVHYRVMLKNLAVVAGPDRAADLNHRAICDPTSHSSESQGSTTPRAGLFSPGPGDGLLG